MMNNTNSPMFGAPKWEEIPDLYLYMDQVISVLEKYLSPFSLEGGEVAITQAMINNYVKQRLIPPPEKKRYGREQLALLYICALLKQVLTLGELDALLKHEMKEGGVAGVYARFSTALEGAMGEVFGDEKEREGEKTIFFSGCAAFAHQLYARRMLRDLMPKEEPKEEEESKKKKKKAKEEKPQEEEKE